MRPSLFICLLLSVAVLAVYSQVVNHNFLYFDDGIDVVNNPHIKQGLTAESVGWAFTTLEHANWQPLTRLSHILITQLFGMSAPAGLLFNVLIHLANALLLFFVLQKFTGSTWKSGLVAALFALHPLRVESVAWLTERKDVLSGLFWMLTLYTYNTYVKSYRREKYLLCLFFFLMGILSKPIVVTLPCVLILLDYWPLARTKNRRISWLIKEKIPFFILSACSSIITIVAHQRASALHTLETVSLYHRLANGAVSYMEYIQKTMWPFDLAVFYTMPARFPPLLIVMSVILITAITALVILTSKQHGYLAVGWLWFLGTLIPVIGIISWGFHRLADRFTYLPSIGLFIALVWGIHTLTQSWRKRKALLIAATVTVLFSLSVISWSQVRYWKDFKTLFTHATNVSPGNWWGLTALGGAYAFEGQPDKAIRLYKEALTINPDYPVAHLMLGKAFAAVGEKDEALIHFSKALQLDDKIVSAYVATGDLLVEKGKQKEGAEYFFRALEIDPASANAHFSIGCLFMNQGRLYKAIEYFRKSLSIDPHSFSTHNNLGVALYNQGKSQEAIYHFKEALKLNPGDKSVKNNVEKIRSSWTKTRKP